MADAVPIDRLENLLDEYLAQCRTHSAPYRIDLDHLELRNFLVYPGVLSPKYDIDSRFFPQAVADIVGRNTLLEIGTGTGIVAIHCVRTHRTPTVASDINHSAVDNCVENAAACDLFYPLIDIRHGDLFAPVRADEKFEFIFWNHPWSTAPGSGDDLGLAVFDPGYRQLDRYLREARDHLTASGSVLLGTSDIADTGLIRQLAERYGYSADIAATHTTTAQYPAGEHRDVTMLIYRFRPGTALQ